MLTLTDLTNRNPEVLAREPLSNCLRYTSVGDVSGTLESRGTKLSFETQYWMEVEE